MHLVVETHTAAFDQTLGFTRRGAEPQVLQQGHQLHPTRSACRPSDLRHILRNLFVAEAAVEGLAGLQGSLTRVELRGDFLRQTRLGFARMPSQQLVDLALGHIGQQRVPLAHHAILDGHDLAVHIFRHIVEGDGIAITLAHLAAIQAVDQRSRKANLTTLPFLALQIAPAQQVEQLICAAQLQIRTHHDRVPTLHQGIEELMDADRLVVSDALLKGVTLDHARHCHPSTELEHVLKAHLIEPLGVAPDLRLRQIQQLGSLVHIRLEVLLHCSPRQRRAQFVAA